MVRLLLTTGALAVVMLVALPAQAGSGAKVIHAQSMTGKASGHYTWHDRNRRRHKGFHASALASPSYCRLREVYVGGLTYSRLDCHAPPGLPFAQPEQPWAYTYFRDRIQWDQSLAWQSHLQPGHYSPNTYWGY